MSILIPVEWIADFWVHEESGSLLTSVLAGKPDCHHHVQSARLDFDQHAMRQRLCVSRPTWYCSLYIMSRILRTRPFGGRGWRNEHRNVSVSAPSHKATEALAVTIVSGTPASCGMNAERCTPDRNALNQTHPQGAVLGQNLKVLHRQKFCHWFHACSRVLPNDWLMWCPRRSGSQLQLHCNCFKMLLSAHKSTQSLLTLKKTKSPYSTASIHVLVAHVHVSPNTSLSSRSGVK